MEIMQYYGAGGVPMAIEADTAAPAAAWRSHRERLRAWLDEVPDEQWGAPTRCDEWDVLDLVRHLASGSQFLGYTLYMATKGQPTTLLREFDTQDTARERSEELGSLDPPSARRLLREMDQRVEAVMGRLLAEDWAMVAEAPPGHMPAHLVVSHFVFDSWIHERDLLVPRGQRPVTDEVEAGVVARYVVGLFGPSGAVDDDVVFGVRLTDIEVELRLAHDAGRWLVSTGPLGPVDAVVEGRAGDVLDRATGRDAHGVGGDQLGVGVLDAFARGMGA
jgi:uncharacterized protein (TIGR03083 family)